MNHSILVLGNIPEALQHMATILGSRIHTCSISTASVNGDFEDRIRAASPDLLVLDCDEVSEIERAGFHRLRKEAAFAAIPLLVVASANGTETKILSSDDPPPSGYLQKPYTGEELVIQAATLLRLAELQRSLCQYEAGLSDEGDTDGTSLEERDEPLDASSVGTFILDRNHRIVWVNRAVERYFGLDRASLIGRDQRDVVERTLKHVFADPDTFSRELLSAYERHDHMDRFECRVRESDGRPERWLELRSESIRSGLHAGGRIDHYIDITEVKRLEEQFLQAQKMESVGRLAGGIAHDFNNLLTSVLGFSRLLLDDLEPDSPSRSDVEQIVHAAERATKLTRQLLAFGRKQILKVEPIDLNSTVRTMVSILHRTLGEDVELMTHLEENLPHIAADDGQVEQVLMNLAVNARDAMPNGGQLAVLTSATTLDEAACRRSGELKPGPHVLLIVRDSGWGMSKEIREHAFEPFFTTKEVGKGTGLGLSTVFGIIRQFGGDIDIESEPGKGTEIRIYLPCAETSRVQPQAVAEIPPPEGTETILVVEDEDAVRALTMRLLRSQGYHVLEARAGGEALDVCRRHEGKIDMVVTDVVMPLMSGPQMVEEAAKIRPEAKVLYTTGFSEDAAIKRGMSKADVDVLVKPYERKTLAHKVREILDRA